jgi:hypothetical protein
MGGIQSSYHWTFTANDARRTTIWGVGAQSRIATGCDMKAHGLSEKKAPFYMKCFPELADAKEATAVALEDAADPEIELLPVAAETIKTVGGWRSSYKLLDPEVIKLPQTMRKLEKKMASMSQVLDTVPRGSRSTSTDEIAIKAVLTRARRKTFDASRAACLRKAP